MYTLQDTGLTGTITWLGKVPSQPQDIRSAKIGQMPLSFEGTEGEHHSGLTRGACVRVKNLYAEGTEIRNVRQFTILSAEEMALTAADIGLEQLNPEWLGASIIIEGIPDFTHVPPASRLQAPDGSVLTIDMLNAPCNWPGKEIEKDNPGHGKAYRRAAEGRRGVTAWVEREGVLNVGDKLQLFVPGQRAWQGA